MKNIKLAIEFFVFEKQLGGVIFSNVIGDHSFNGTKSYRCWKPRTQNYEMFSGYRKVELVEYLESLSV